MPVQEKILFTCIVLVLSIGVVLIDPKAKNQIPKWARRGEGFNELMCKPDGSLRRHTKTGILLGIAIMLGIMWVVG